MSELVQDLYNEFDIIVAGITEAPAELDRPEAPDDATVDRTFQELMTQIDEVTTPEDREALQAVPNRKVTGSEQAYNMWRN